MSSKVHVYSSIPRRSDPRTCVVDLAGCTIPDFGERFRQDVSGHGQLTVEILADLLVHEWVPYTECDHCGRFSYCAFVERNPYNPDRAQDIRCGVAVKALREFITRTAHLVSGGPAPDVQAYLDGAFHFFRYTHDAEIGTGRFLDAGMLDFYAEQVPMVFGSIAGRRRHLDKMAEALDRFPEFRTSASVLLVEGHTEAQFVTTLRESGFAWFLYFDVASYDGKGNADAKRLRMLLKDYKKRGYKVYAQGDRDGHPTGAVDGLVDSGLLASDNAFLFGFDFESAVPLGLLYDVLVDLGRAPVGVSRVGFVATLASATTAISKAIPTTWALDLSADKPGLAAALARRIISTDLWWQDEEFMKTELGRFLHFVCRV